MPSPPPTLKRVDGSTPSDIPLIACAESGFSCLSCAVSDWAPCASATVLATADAMRAHPEGPLVAAVRHPAAPRTVGLVQTNRGRFYESVHGVPFGPCERAWRDFYHDVAWALAHLLDE